MRFFMIIMVIWLSVHSPMSSAKSTALAASLLPTENQVNRQPWQSYQLILKQLKITVANKDVNYLWLLLRKAQAEDLLYFHDDFEQTVKQANKLITTLTPSQISSTFTYFAGIIAQRHSHYTQAIKLFNSAMQQAHDAHLTRLLVMIKQELAYTRSLTESYESSLNSLQEAYVQAFTLNDQSLLASINETYGDIYGYMGEYEKSIEYYQKALIAYQQLHYPSYIAQVMYGLAATYRYWKKYDQALEQFKAYQAALTYTPSKGIGYFAAYGLGMTLAEKGDCELAIPEINKALLLHGQLDFDAELYKRKASCLLKLKHISEAKRVLKKAIEIFSSLNELKGTAWQLETDKITAQIYFAEGNNQLAYQLLANYYQQYVQVLETQSANRLTRVRNLLDAQRRDVEIALLKQRSQVQLLTENLYNQHRLTHYIIVMGVFIFLLICVLVSILFKRNNRRLKHNVKNQ